MHVYIHTYHKESRADRARLEFGGKIRRRLPRAFRPSQTDSNKSTLAYIYGD